MQRIQSQNLSFRCPLSLKAKIQEYALENEMHLSNAIRYVMNDFMNSKELKQAIKNIGASNNDK
jgi:hypothetical protein